MVMTMLVATLLNAFYSTDNKMRLGLRVASTSLRRQRLGVEGYLAHKEAHPPRTLQYPLGPRTGA